MKRFLTLTLLLMLIGGHVAGLQLVAWSTMFVERVQYQGFYQAIEETLSGQYACRICKAVVQLQDDAQGNPAGTPKGKQDPSLKIIKKCDSAIVWDALVELQAYQPAGLYVRPELSRYVEQCGPSVEPPPPRV